jgi:uncharacterized protein (DUF4415 family)
MNDKAQKVGIDVTDKEHQSDLTNSLQEEEVRKPGRRAFKRGAFLARHGLKGKEELAPVKVRISINLDLDVLEYFKQRAAQPNAAPYQTQINHTLREVMEREREQARAALSAQAEALLADPQFIDAVAERVQARLPQLAAQAIAS